MRDEFSATMPADSVVLVTAGGAGIGRCIAEAFLSQGANVHVCDVDEKALVDIANCHPGVTTTVADVSVASEVDRVFEDLARQFGRLDVLVNNAGIAGPTALVENVARDDWEKTINVCLTANFLFSQRAVVYLKQSSGSIINIASNAAFTGCPGRAPYTAAKWAVVGLTKTLAMELGKFGVRVNAICPCSVDGDRIDSVLSRDAKRLGRPKAEIREVYQRQSSLRKFIKADDVANMAVFLASELGRSISGQAIGIDGNTETLANWLED